MTQGRGAVSDLSSTGCFVLSGGQVSSGEFIRLQITFPLEVATVWGQIVYSIAEVGFALRFTFGNEEEQRALGRSIEGLN